jgi:hypothetical protein
MPHTCEVCSKETQRWKRCDDHYKCDDCGAGEGLCTYVEGVLCEQCHDARVQKRIETFDGDHEYTYEAVCPHCGYVEGDSWEMSEGVRNCGDCDREYELTRNTEVTYTTAKA